MYNEDSLWSLQLDDSLTQALLALGTHTHTAGTRGPAVSLTRVPSSHLSELRGLFVQPDLHSHVHTVSQLSSTYH